MKKHTIRMETSADHEAVYALVKSAFTAINFYENEDGLIKRMRETTAFIPELSLVAEAGDKLIGHIMFTKITIGAHTELVLGPVAVLPEYQKQGVGGALINRGHEIAAELGYKLCMLVGHADYYPRYGYERASKYGISQPFPAPDECVMVFFWQKQDEK
jgi:predicted N-acetyltransferase YhbS